MLLDSPALLLRNTSPDEVRQHLADFASAGPPDATALAASVENKKREKHHPYLSEELLNVDYVSSQLDADGAWQSAMRLSAFFS